MYVRVFCLNILSNSRWQSSPHVVVCFKLLYYCGAKVMVTIMSESPVLPSRPLELCVHLHGTFFRESSWNLDKTIDSDPSPVPDAPVNPTHVCRASRRTNTHTHTRRCTHKQGISPKQPSSATPVPQDDPFPSNPLVCVGSCVCMCSGFPLADK